MPDPIEETPTPELMEALTREGILSEVRGYAIQIDPANARVYRSMSAERWMRAAELASELLLAHWRYKRRRHGGRREHSAAIHTLLDGSNPVQVAAALAWVDMAFWLLPARREHGE